MNKTVTYNVERAFHSENNLIQKNDHTSKTFQCKNNHLTKNYQYLFGNIKKPEFNLTIQIVAKQLIKT